MYWYITQRSRSVGTAKPTTKQPLPTNIWSSLLPLSRRISQISSHEFGVALITFGKWKKRWSLWSGGRQQSIAKGRIQTVDLRSVRLIRRRSGRILMSVQMQQLGSQDCTAVPATSYSLTQTYVSMETQLHVATCGAAVPQHGCRVVVCSNRLSTWLQRYESL